MRILHTADWHLGARLADRDRLPEQSAFLQWLLEVIEHEKIDLLLVSGDIFDAANPPQDAVRLYYEFIHQLTALSDVAAVIIGGNHDSALHLNAPRDLLARFGVRVFGHAAPTPSEELVALPGAVIAAVPFLRERDLRQSVAGETSNDAQEAVHNGIAAHYAAVRSEGRALATGRPLIAMGHLTALGSTTSDSEREIHIGKLGAVGSDLFVGFDYVALGHLHRPQKVAGFDHIRYSGSPIPLSFSESKDEKQIISIETNSDHLVSIQSLAVPQTRRLVRASVNLETLDVDLPSAVPDDCWAEVTVNVEKPEPNLDRRVREIVGSRADVLKVLIQLPETQRPAWQRIGPSLNQMSPREVFEERIRTSGCLDDATELQETFSQLLAEHEKRRLA